MEAIFSPERKSPRFPRAQDAGYEVKDGPASILVVDSAVAVGDNMEAPPGMIINVFGSTLEMEYG